MPFSQGTISLGTASAGPARCFGAPICIRPAERLTLSLADHHGAALAALLPLLGCGEEAATLAFDDLSGSASDPREAAALARIADEERTHDAIISALIEALPPDPQAAAIRRAARRFHIDLGRDGPILRLARMAATDAAVCTILSRLGEARRPLANDPVIATRLRRIHRDEAHHVRVTRALANNAGTGRTARDAGCAAREALANVLQLRACAFEALGVDPQRLDRDLRILPDGLFAA